MKKVIQLALFLILIVICILFYKVYFQKNQTVEIEKREIEEVQESDSNNLIKNLVYDVKIENNKQYLIKSESSEINYENDSEIIKMRKVIAQFIDGSNEPIKIISDVALYNNTNHNTNFLGNIKIEYDENLILSDKVDLDFASQDIHIFENVTFKSLNGNIKTDNIKISLITKKIEIFMNNENDKVKLITTK
tara:strand:- start:90 stop:665 length:576 start_codon:yes stop_codon:yes gene_type:complete